MRFEQLVGQKIFVVTNINVLEEQRIHGSTAVAELAGVESGGLWVKHEGLSKDLEKLHDTGRGFIVPVRPDVEGHLFLPFSSIVFVSVLSPVLDEGSLGLDGGIHEPSG